VAEAQRTAAIGLAQLAHRLAAVAPQGGGGHLGEVVAQVGAGALVDQALQRQPLHPHGQEGHGGELRHRLAVPGQHTS